MIHPRGPRYASLDDWEADCKEGGLKRAIMPFKIINGEAVINPDYPDAPFGIGIVMMKDEFKVATPERHANVEVG